MAAESIEERQGRLQALRLAAELSVAPETHDDSDGEAETNKDSEGEAGSEPKPLIRFRNYVPRDEQLKELKVAPPQVPNFDYPVVGPPTETNGTEDPIISIAPKKANWDLRRDVAKKLEKLERRTQRAIIELMQEEEKRRQAAQEEAGAEGELGMD